MSWADVASPLMKDAVRACASTGRSVAADVGRTVAPDALALSAPTSHVAAAVRAALAPGLDRTVPHAQVLTSGRIEDIWLKGNDYAHNEIVDKAIAATMAARHEVRIQTYTFDFESESSTKLMEALAQKQRENPAFKIFIAYSGEIKINPMSWAKTMKCPEMKAALARFGVKAEVASFLKLPSRGFDHSKTFIWDGVRGAIGGVNIQNHPSKDSMVEVSGPVVDTLLSDFDSAWKESKQFFRYDGSRIVEGTRDLPPAIQGEALPSSQPLVPMTFLSKRHVAYFTHGKDPYANDADKGLMAAFAAARKEIKLTTPNNNDRRVWQAMADAARRGVKVKLLMPMRFNDYREIVDGANNEQFINKFWSQLPPDARKNFELRWFTPDATHATPPTNNNHTKYASVDGVWAYVGSQNLDKQSWVYSREAGLGVESARVTLKLDQALFNGDWNAGFAIPRPAPAGTAVGRWIQRHIGF